MINYIGSAEKNFVELVRQNQKPNMIVVEIGCYSGDTTIEYIDIVKQNNGHVYVIDTFCGTELSELELEVNGDHRLHQFEGDWNKDLYDFFLKRFEDYHEMLTILKGYSHEKIPLLPNNCDIIFIDADHKYKSVKKDIELAKNKVKVGGILSGHDLETFKHVNTYEPWELELDWSRNHHPGVAQAVFESFGITETLGYVWYVKLPLISFNLSI